MTTTADLAKFALETNELLSSGFLRNRIINGDMRIDQRNGGAAFATVPGSEVYSLDRWASNSTGGQRFSFQRVADAPAGFVNSLKITTTTAAAPAAADYSYLVQHIEGSHCADLAWGTANAKPVALSFWMKSSLTGTFSAAILNNASDRSYVLSWSIPVANTWTYVTATIPGDVTGTWVTDNTRALRLYFNLGAGANNSTSTANTWLPGAVENVTGSISVGGTLSATINLTGVQLEAGTQATAFERRFYAAELALCQRYCEMISGGVTGYCASGTIARVGIPFKVSKRAAPTLEKQITGTSYVNNTGGNPLITSYTLNAATTEGVYLDCTTGGTFTSGQGCLVQISAGTLSFTAEL